MKPYLAKEVPEADIQTASVIDELSFWSSHFGQVLLDKIPMAKGWKVLDVACGTGFPLIELAHRLGSSCQVTGLDLWKEGLERAEFKRNFYGLEHVTLLEADASNMPLESESFDLIVSNLGINNLANPAGAIQECFRVAKPGASLCMTTNLEGHLSVFYRMYEASLKALNLEEYLPALAEQEAHRGSQESVIQLLKSKGFEIVRMEKENFDFRYLDASALLNHSLTIWFLGGWRKVIPPSKEEAVFSEIERRLDLLAEKEGELRMGIPRFYVEARKP